MNNFAQALAEKDFVVTVELDPPKGVDLEPLEDLAKKISERADAVVVSDNPRATALMGPLIAAHKLIKHAGAEVIMTLACRDRNRMALTSDMLAAWSAGVRTLLLVSGDYFNLGDHPQAKAVYDLDSVQALGLGHSLNQGADLAGNQLAGAPDFLLGSTISPRSEPSAPQVMKFHKKIQAGAGFFITRPLTRAEELEGFMDQAGQVQVKVLAGLEASDPAGFKEAAGLASALKQSGRAAGVHLSAPGMEQSLPDLMDACGL